MTVPSSSGRGFLVGLAFATGGVASACDPTPATFGPPRQAGTLGLEGGDLYYLAVGVGDPIIAIHGGPGLDHSYLLPGLEPLTETHKLILYDQRGLGGSPATLDSAGISMTRYLDDLDALRGRVAGAESVVLLAHSWGSIPATLYAMRWPQRVRALILMSPVEPGQRYSAQAEANQQARRSEEDQRAIDSLSALPWFQRGDAALLSQLLFHVFRGTFADPAKADSGLSIRLADRTARQGGTVARLLLTPLAGLDFWDELAQLDVPVLIVHGDRDPIPVQMVREMAAALPDARLAVLDNVGHFPFIEAPGELFGEIAGFLRELDARPE